MWKAWDKSKNHQKPPGGSEDKDPIAEMSEVIHNRFRFDRVECDAKFTGEHMGFQRTPQGPLSNI